MARTPLGSYRFELASAPGSPRARELWLQHAAGFLLFQDVRGYAIELVDPSLSEPARAAVVKAIDDAVYGLMMVFDGVSGSLRSLDHRVHLKTTVCLSRRQDDREELVEELDLFHGDGMCMGYHGWLEGDFGEDPVVNGVRK